MFSLYKPNSKNTGCAFAFKEGVTVKNYEPCVYVNGIQQHSWNDATKNGSFSENAKNPEKIIAFKLNEFELGGLINAIENRVEYKAFHTFDDNKTVDIPCNTEMFNIESDAYDHEFKEGMAWGLTMIKPDQN